MKSTYLIAGLLLATVTFTACNNEESVKETNTTEQSEAEAMLLHTQPASPGGLAGAQSASVAAQPAAQVQNVTKGSTQAAKTAAGMNPPHGQPGHRCDIAEGAPLNSPAAAPASKTVTMPQGGGAAPAMQVAPATAQPVSGNSASGKMNPAHGQPGHDCAVPVGAPLKG